MLAYYLELALRSFRRSPGLTALMVLTIAIGVAACMTTLTVFHVLSGDPIPRKSDRLFNVQLAADPQRDHGPEDEPNFQLTRLDAEALLRDKRGARQVMMVGGNVSVEAEGQRGFFADARYASADFFAMFDAPFKYGSGWSAEDDGRMARVAVISEELNERLFGGADSRGKIIRLREREFRIIGVLQRWRPVPHYYDISIGHFRDAEDVYLPFSTATDLHFASMGNFNCWAEHPPGAVRDVGAPCDWVQYWVELSAADQAGDYRRYLVDYAEAQRRAGRFERPAHLARARSVMEWLQHTQVVPGDIRLQLWLAFGFLAVCLTNTVGLLLAKSLRRSSEIGVRRALGAPRRAIFAQFLVEAGSLGLAGGLLGLALTLLGLWGVRHGASGYAALVELDLAMLASTLGLALLASLLAGLLPAWRAAQVTPALQLKTQ